MVIPQETNIKCNFTSLCERGSCKINNKLSPPAHTKIFKPFVDSLDRKNTETVNTINQCVIITKWHTENHE